MTHTTTADPAMTDIDFYTPPDRQPHHRPGDILRLRPTPTPGLPGAGTAWQLLYLSHDTFDEPIPVSGTVITPAEGDDRAAPMLVYYPVFHGLGGDCAPSQRLAAGTEPDTAQISAALAGGWRVAVVDGEGLGVRGHGPHTFLAAHAAGQIMLDLARAATRIPALHATDTPVVLWGYGDGARAAIRAGELQPGYAPQLNLRGLAAGAVVTDLRQIVDVLDQGAWPALGLAALLGLSRAYRHIPLRHVFALEARSLLADAEHASVEVLCQRYQHALATWCDRPVSADPMWQYVFDHDRTSTQLPGVPVHLYHGSRDAIVPPAIGRALARDYRARGVETSWREYDADHFRTRTQAITEVLAHLTTTAGASAADRTTHP